MRRPFDSVRATAAEVAASRPGDELIACPDAVMDRAFTLPATPEQVWPWLIQLGKRRAGWYLPRPIERLVPPGRRASRTIDPRWQALRVGDVIPDYGGRNESFQVAQIAAPASLVYTSTRGRMRVSWALTLTSAEPAGTSTRVHLRLRLGPVRRKWLVGSAGELLDAVTVAGMAAGLRERLRATASRS